MNQREIFDATQQWRPRNVNPPLPPYSTGECEEELFCSIYCSMDGPGTNKGIGNYLYLPIYWKSLGTDSRDLRLNQFLSLLPKDQRYFTISSHDIGPLYNLPPDTTVFSTSSYVFGAHKVPIPYVWESHSKHEYITDSDRTIYASMICSDTHPLRMVVEHLYRDMENWVVQMKPWDRKVSFYEQIISEECLKRSVFTLCPRGFGTNTLRFYEALLYGSIPVYISDEFWLPGPPEFSTCCVPVRAHDITQLPGILEQAYKRREELVGFGQQVVEKYLTASGLYSYVRSILNSTSN
jgi:hypothetical protein